MSRTSAIVLPRNVTSEGLGREPAPVAGVARDPDVGEEVHLDPLLARPLARLAPAAGLVEAEPPGGVAADLGLGQLGEQLADQVERAGVRGRRSRSACSPSGVWSTLMTLSTWSRSPRSSSCAPGSPAPGGASWRRPSRGCPRRANSCPSPLTPVTTVTTADRERDVDVLEVVVPGVADDQRRAVADGAAVGGHGDRRRPLRYLPVSDVRSTLTFAGEPAAVTSPPRSPEPGPKSTRWSAASITSRSCSTRTSVLPRSRSRLSAPQEPGVVARVEADGRLVEDVEDARQAAADLAGQPDALALAAREGGRPAGEAEVVEADVVEELEAVADLADEVAGDVLLVVGEPSVLKNSPGPGRAASRRPGRA